MRYFRSFSGDGIYFTFISKALVHIVNGKLHVRGKEKNTEIWQNAVTKKFQIQHNSCHWVRFSLEYHSILAPETTGFHKS